MEKYKYTDTRSQVGIPNCTLSMSPSFSYKSSDIRQNNLSQKSIATMTSNKMAPDAAADIASSESLSFAGLVSIQDQHPPNQLRKSLPMPLPIPAANMQKIEPEFEFESTKSSSKLGNLINDFSIDKSFSDSQVLPKVKVPANQSQVSNRIDLEAMLSPIRSHRRSELKFRNSGKKQIMEVKYKTNEKRPSSQSFSQRFFQSFATPCRDCRTVQPAPSMKEHALQ